MDGATNGAKEISDTGKAEFAMSGALVAGGLKNSHDFRGWYARSDSVNGGVSHGAVAIKDENGWLRNAASFPCVVDIPLLYHVSFRVAQNRKRQVKFLPYRIRLLLLIDGNGNEVRAGRANFFIMLPVFRQLAKAERSPVAAIKQENERTAGD
ncbi:MAG: hypothetical protein WA876_08660 [Candidatus Acidiferrales bacterium]